MPRRRRPGKRIRELHKRKADECELSANVVSKKKTDRRNSPNSQTPRADKPSSARALSSRSGAHSKPIAVNIGESSSCDAAESDAFDCSVRNVEVKREKLDPDIENNQIHKFEEEDCSMVTAKEEPDQAIDFATQRLLLDALNPSFIFEVQGYLNSILPPDWFCKTSDDGFNIMLLSRCPEKAIQRRISLSFQGNVSVSVHRKPLLLSDVDQLLSGLLPVMPLTEDDCSIFVEHALKIVKKLWYFEICCGADQPEYRLYWPKVKHGVVDNNPYGEIRYACTLRSLRCKFLVESSRWRCKECTFLIESLERKDKQRRASGILTLSEDENTDQIFGNLNDHYASKSVVKNNPDTSKTFISNLLPLPRICSEASSASNFLSNSNSTLIHEDKTSSLINPSSVIPSPENNSVQAWRSKEQATQQKYEVFTATQKIKNQLEKDGIPVDEGMARDLSEIIKDLKLSAIQQQFIQNQFELAASKKSFGMRWHPTLIRFALYMKSTSSEKYTATGMITLPSGRTLYNFSQVLFRIKEFQKADMNDILKRIKLSSEPGHNYHSLIIDEIDVSNNLVYQKSNGELIGFVKLSDAKTEMEQLEDFINNSKLINLKPVACHMLVFMVKGISTNVKEVIALLASDNMPKQMVHHLTWDVIDTLEQSGIKIIAVVSNGSSKTKDFIRLHVPVTRLQSSLVFDTINSKARGRLLYFVMDTFYLLKSIRNCFEESGSSGGSQKLLTKNKQAIVWKTIVRLYLAQKWRCPKLNVQNVFLNDHTRRTPSYALEIFSTAVWKDLSARCWPDTSETVVFLSKVNDLAQSLCGTEEDDGSIDEVYAATPYILKSDKRFSKMQGFLDYLNDWRKEVNDIPKLSPEDQSKMLLGDELCREIELSVRAVVDASKFLFDEGANIIDARAFCIDSITEYLQEGWFGFKFSCNSVVSQFFVKESIVENQKM